MSSPKGSLFYPQYAKRDIRRRNNGAVANLNEPRRSYLIYIIRIYPKQTQSHSCLTPPFKALQHIQTQLGRSPRSFPKSSGFTFIPESHRARMVKLLFVRR